MKLHGSRQAIRLSAGGTRTPPTEFRIWAYGDVLTTKGNFKLTPRSAQALIRERSQHDADVMIDWEHNAVDPSSSGPTPAAGWCNLEARSDGLWAVNVHWSPVATKLLSTGEYRYFSPCFQVLKRTGEIIELVNIALTNLPATKNIQALVAASRMKKITAAHTPSQEQPMKFGEKLSKHAKDNNLSPAAMAEKCGIEMERMRKLTAGEDPTPEEMKACSKALGFGDDDGDGGADEEKTSDDGGVDDQPDADADDDEKEESATAQDLTRELIKLTKTQDPTRMRGVLAATFRKAAMFDEDHKALVELKRENEERKREALVKLGKEKKQLTPSLLRFWTKRPVAEFEAFLEHAPSISGEDFREPEGPRDNVRLSREEKMVAEIADRDPEELAKFISEENSGKAAAAIRASYRTK